MLIHFKNYFHYFHLTFMIVIILVETVFGEVEGSRKQKTPTVNQWGFEEGAERLGQHGAGEFNLVATAIGAELFLEQGIAGDGLVREQASVAGGEDEGGFELDFAGVDGFHEVGNRVLRILATLHAGLLGDVAEFFTGHGGEGGFSEQSGVVFHICVFRLIVYVFHLQGRV